MTHPGNHKGQTPHEGIAAFVLGMAEAARGLKTHGLAVLLENTVGSGANLGSRFEELHMIRELARLKLIWMSGTAWIRATSLPPGSTSRSVTDCSGRWIMRIRFWGWGT